MVWVENGRLYGELRAKHPFLWTYELTEEDHHFKKEADGKYYRVSKIYKDTKNRISGVRVKHELIWDNHSEVMFPVELIPEEMIRND